MYLWSVAMSNSCVMLKMAADDCSFTKHHPGTQLQRVSHYAKENKTPGSKSKYSQAEFSREAAACAVCQLPPGKNLAATRRVEQHSTQSLER